MVSYKEVAKPIDEILEKQFVHGKPWSVDLKHKLDNPSLKLTGHLGSDGKVACASSAGANMGAFAANGILAIDGSASLQLSYNSDFCKGLTLQTNLVSSVKTVREQKVELQAKYNKDPWKVHATINAMDRKWGFAMTGKHPVASTGHNILYGVDFSGDSCSAPTFSGAAIGYNYPIKNHVISTAVSVAPYGNQQFGKITAAISSQTCSQSELAARYTYIPLEDRGELCVGAGWIMDPATKLTSVKARIDDNVNIAAAITHKLNDSASITVGIGFDGNHKINAEHAAKVGVKLNLTA